MTNPTNGPQEMGDDDLHRALLAAIEAADGIPTEVLGGARGAFVWRDIDAELAELAYDSMLDADALAGVRGTATAASPRALTFDALGFTVEVEVESDGGERRIIGQLVPPQAATIEIRHGGGTTTVEADDIGRFAATGIAAGPVSLRCRLAGASRTVGTEWLVI